MQLRRTPAVCVLAASCFGLFVVVTLAVGVLALTYWAGQLFRFVVPQWWDYVAYASMGASVVILPLQWWCFGRGAYEACRANADDVHPPGRKDAPHLRGAA